jgi:hypothetical protein
VKGSGIFRTPFSEFVAGAGSVVRGAKRLAKTVAPAAATKAAMVVQEFSLQNETELLM